MTQNLSRVLLVAGVCVVLAMGTGAGFILFGGEKHNAPGQGTALIGGAFELTNHTGQRVTDQDFRGKYMLVYFGFTSCPDMCPTSLTLMSDALDILADTDPDLVKSITPVFITLDPERDQVAEMAAYIAHFFPGMVGLTGSADDIRTAARAYRVFYQKTPPENSGDYLIDHSSITFLMGPDGDYLQHFAHGTDGARMAENIRKTLR